MKKLLLILLAFVALFSTSCKEDSYSVYNYGLTNWSNSFGVSNNAAMDKVYEDIANEFISSGLVIRGYQIYSDDVTKNDAQALHYFDQNMTRIQDITIPALEKSLLGTANAPFTISVDYLVLRGATTQYSLKYVPLIIKVEPKPAQ